MEEYTSNNIKVVVYYIFTPDRDNRTWADPYDAKASSWKERAMSIVEKVRMENACVYVLLFGGDMLSKYLNTMLGFEFANETRVPVECAMNTMKTRAEIKEAYQSSLAIPKSLQQRIRALLLHASVAVAIPEGSKYSCSPLAIATNLESRPISFNSQSTVFREYDAPSEADQSVFSTDDFGTNVRLTAGSETPGSRSKSKVQDPSILDFRKIKQAV